MFEPKDKKGKDNYVCAVYTRLSHLEPEERSESDSIKAQKKRCRDFIEFKKPNGWKLREVDYDDYNYSGGTLDRPNLKKLLNDAKEGKFNMVVVKTVDRLTRSLKHFYQIWEYFEKYGIHLCATEEEFNTSTATGRLHLDIVLRFAQFEREMASERTKFKMRFRAEQGLFHGGYPPLGYDFVPSEKGLLAINRNEVALAKLIFQKYIKVQSAHLVAKFLNEAGYKTKEWRTAEKKKKGGKKFSESIILNLLKNVAYIAKTPANNKLNEAQWKPIIDEKTFNRVQRILKHNAKTRGSISENKYKLLLTGLVWCANCKSQMTPNYTLKKGKDGKRTPYLYYKCTKVDHSDKTACEIKSVSARELERLIISRIKFLSEHKNSTIAIARRAMKSAKNKLPVLRKDKNGIVSKLNKINNDAELLMGSFGKDDISLVKAKLKKLDDDKFILEKRLTELNEELETERQKVISPEVITRNLIDFSAIFSQLSFENQRLLLHLLVKKIIYSKDHNKVQIIFNNLPEIKMPPEQPNKGGSGGISSRFDERMYWLPREDSNLGPSG